MTKLDQLLHVLDRIRTSNAPVASAAAVPSRNDDVQAMRQALDLMDEMNAEKPTPAMLAYAREARLDISKLFPGSK